MAATLEYLDQTIHTGEEIEAVASLPLLAAIPTITGAMNGAGGPMDERHLRLITQLEPRSPAAEGYRGLRTSLTFATPDNPPKILVVTSPSPEEGKTTTAANLAVTLAQAGTSTLLMDTDLRRGLTHQVVGIDRVLRRIRRCRQQDRRRGVARRCLARGEPAETAPGDSRHPLQCLGARLRNTGAGPFAPLGGRRFASPTYRARDRGSDRAPAALLTGRRRLGLLRFQHRHAKTGGQPDLLHHGDDSHRPGRCP